MGLRDDLMKAKKELEEVKQESFALEIIKEQNKKNKRLTISFTIIIVTLLLILGSVTSYLIYTLNDIGTMEVTQENDENKRIFNSTNKYGVKYK